jgi:hypothetical protein
MTTTAIETVPAIWDDARDIPFFRITARLFSPEFCVAASVLLAGYDDTTGVANHIHAERDLIPVRVRRVR